MLTKDQEYQVRKLRAEYVENSPSLRKLWELDAKVKDPAKEAAWVCGILGALLTVLRKFIVDIDTVLFMECLFAGYLEFWEALVGIVQFFSGPVLILAAYPVYRLILNARKKKYAFEILKLTNELLND